MKNRRTNNIKTLRARIRRATSGVSVNPEREEEHLSAQFGRAYDAWRKRRGIGKWDADPSLGRGE